MAAYTSTPGGYELEIVKEPPQSIQIECPVCLSILREPFQVTCCGYDFCKACIERIRSSTRTCPCCVARNFTVFEDKRLKRSLCSLKVHCIHKNNGCQWEGELGQLEAHLNTNPVTQPSDKHLKGCKFVKIKCFHCSKLFRRNELHVHETNHCPQRPTICKYCKQYTSSYEDIVNNHWEVCASYMIFCPNMCGKLLTRGKCDEHVSQQCPLAVIDCEFKGVGCEIKLLRNEMAAHLSNSTATHLSLVASSVTDLSNCVNKHAQDIKALHTTTDQLNRSVKESSEAINRQVTEQRQFMEINLIEHEQDIKVLLSKTNRLYRLARNSSEASNRSINQFIENVGQRVEVLQQQCDWSQEEIGRLRMENIRLAARITNQHPATKYARLKFKICSKPAVILMVILFAILYHYSYIIAQFLSDKNSNSLPRVTVLPAPVTFIMTDYSKHKESGDSWFSPPFYTSVGGYKMRLKVDANGIGPGKGTKISVFVQLLPGKHDDQLKWPLQGEVTVQLMRQNRWSDWEKKILFRKTTPINSSGRVAEEELGEPVGYYNFIPHSVVNDCLSEDSLWFHISFHKKISPLA